MAQRVEGNIDIQAPVEKVYGYWETLENLPRFMSNVEEVRPVGEGQTHWKIKGPFGAEVEFDAQTTRNEENEAIAWNSTGGDVQTSGEVRFRQQGPNSTRVEVVMNYGDLPGGRAGEVASRIVANPKLQMEQDLKNFKDIMEERATPEEVQQRPSAATLQSSLAAFLTSGAGLLVLGAVGLVLLLRRRGSGGASSAGKGAAFRLIVELGKD